ncbi:MAG: peptidylprolyl isomerase [Candidatus Thorarchaeota archaeon]
MGKSKYGKGYQRQKQTKGDSSKKLGAPIRGGKIRASHILVDKFNKAQEIYEELLAGANFEDMAHKNSTCPSRKRGGNLGEFAKGDMVSEFWDANTKLKIGEISQPVKTKYGYHIIKRIG